VLIIDFQPRPLARPCALRAARHYRFDALSSSHFESEFTVETLSDLRSPIERSRTPSQFDLAQTLPDRIGLHADCARKSGCSGEVVRKSCEVGWEPGATCAAAAEPISLYTRHLDSVSGPPESGTGSRTIA